MNKYDITPTDDEENLAFQNLGRKLYYITQQADAQVYERWAKIGLTPEFAEYILMEYRELLHNQRISSHFKKINNQQ